MEVGPPESVVGVSRFTCVCEGGGLGAAIRADLGRYAFVAQSQQGESGLLLSLRIGVLSQGLWATAAYRWNHYARQRGRSRWSRAGAQVLHRAILAFTGIHIDAQRARRPRPGVRARRACVIGPVRMGRNCDIYQGVTFGASMSFDDRPYKPGAPTVGDRLWVGPGAVVAGAITVGDDAAVGTNSLVVRDVPPRGVVVGVPARLVSRRGGSPRSCPRGWTATRRARSPWRRVRKPPSSRRNREARGRVAARMYQGRAVTGRLSGAVA